MSADVHHHFCEISWTCLMGGHTWIGGGVTEKTNKTLSIESNCDLIIENRIGWRIWRIMTPPLFIKCCFNISILSLLFGILLPLLRKMPSHSALLQKMFMVRMTMKFLITWCVTFSKTSVQEMHVHKPQCTASGLFIIISYAWRKCKKQTCNYLSKIVKLWLSLKHQ